MEYGIALGLMCGAFVGILIALVIMKMTKTDGSIKCKYDERQKLVRGEAYKYGFWTLVIYSFCYGLLSGIVEKVVDNLTVMVIGICLAACIEICYSIWHDAYFSLNEDKKKVFIAFGIIGVINIVMGLINLFSGECFENGQLTYRSSNLFCGLLFVVVFIIYSLKNMKNNKEME